MGGFFCFKFCPRLSLFYGLDFKVARIIHIWTLTVMLVTSICLWLFLWISQCFKSVINILNRSPTSQTCHQHIWSPTSVTNIDVTHLDAAIQEHKCRWKCHLKLFWIIWNKYFLKIRRSTIAYWLEILTQIPVYFRCNSLGFSSKYTSRVLAGFRPNSEIIGKFRKLKKFYGHFVKRQKWRI